MRAQRFAPNSTTYLQIAKNLKERLSTPVHELKTYLCLIRKVLLLVQWILTKITGVFVIVTPNLLILDQTFRQRDLITWPILDTI